MGGAPFFSYRSAHSLREIVGGLRALTERNSGEIVGEIVGGEIVGAPRTH